MPRTLNANALTHAAGFRKAAPWGAAFARVSAFSVKTATRLTVEVNGAAVDVPAEALVTMPASPTVGQDYAIWAKPDGSLEATANHTTPPVTGARKIGGFHYAPGGNASGTTGGDSTPGINSYSFWDLKWRPACADPRGMALVADGFWMDIYLTGVDAITNGSSRYNVLIADGSSPPKVPPLFGGDGSATYGSYTWFEAQELSAAFGKRTPTQMEFMAATYGVTQATSRGSDPINTILDAARTSKWGLIGATGNLWAWGEELGGPNSTVATEGRGTTTSMPNACLLGGSWSDGANAGSRCSSWYNAASDSSSLIGSRFACDHLALE